MKIRIFDANQRNQVKSGYGLMAFQLAENLKALGHEVVFFPDDKKGEDVVLWIRPPHYVKYPEFNPDKINVFYTMHESETFDDWKKDWCELLNKTKAVITPTEWNKQVWIKGGVSVPVYVVPLGVNPKDFHGTKSYQFSILTLHNALGSENSRESWQDTLRAYYKAFYGNHNKEVSLTIKSYNIRYDGYYSFLETLQKGLDPTQIPPINLLDLALLSQDLNELYSKHWIFLKNTNREGWCLPLLEAISAGVKVVYTDLPVFEWVSNGVGRKFKLGDIQGLTEILLDEFRHWEKEKGFITQFSWKKCAEKVEAVLKEVVENA